MKTLKKRWILSIVMISLFLLASTTLSAQEKISVFEIATPDLSQFSLRYKFGNENMLFRISAIGFDRISRTYEVPDNKTENFYNMGIGIGIEFPKKLTETMTFHYGFGAGVNNLLRKYDNGYKSLGLNASGILGFNYKITDGLRLGAEIQPHIGYSETKSNSQTTKGTNLIISSSNALIVLGFAF
jgi:putative salt-induced outer membrane protein YdiY